MIAGVTKAWTRDEVADDLRAALDLVAELDPPAELAGLTFQYAVQLLTQVAVRPSGLGVTLSGHQL